jgi:hypothetical protein
MPGDNSKQMSPWEAPFGRGRIWQPRFYDFVVFSEHKRLQKLRYIHRNPVKRGLVEEPQYGDLEQLSPLRL